MGLKTSEIATQIRDIDRFLLEYSLADKLNAAAIKSYPGRKTEICISSCKDISFTLESMKYEHLYNESCDRKLYNYLMLDGALVQMHYLFDNENIVKHRLAYLPSPDIEAFQQEPEIFIEQPIYAEIIDLSIVPVPIRFDFDRLSFMEESHPMSHLTLGQYKNCRIPVMAPITPFVFIDFILRNFYNTAYRTYHPLLPKNKKRFINTIGSREMSSMHIGLI
jgi:hypothetical protein